MPREKPERAEQIIPKLREAETKSKQDLRGLWTDREPTPPWPWRHNDHERTGKQKATR